MNTMTTITIDRAMLEQALEALDVSRRFVYQDSRPQVDAAFDALSAALAAPATEPEPAEQQDDGSNVVWKATNIYGETAHFGVHSAAKAWARSGTVAPVKIRDLRLVPTPDVPCKTCEALSRAVLLDQVSDDRRIAPEQPAWHDAPEVAALKSEIERLRKDAERLDYIEESGNFGVTRYRSRPGGPVLIEAEDGKKDISKSASSLRDAIDSVIKEAK